MLLLTGVLFAAIVPEKSPHDLVFPALASTWDEGIPLGNGMIGTLVWGRGDRLRFSLDRADLWDLRPVKEFAGEKFRFRWIQEQVCKGDYAPVQQMSDLPYERDPAPTKIPAGALEFPLPANGKVESVSLFLRQAACEVKWTSGARLLVFVHATVPVGWFRFENVDEDIVPRLLAPNYGGVDTAAGVGNSVTGLALSRLGYPAPRVTAEEGHCHYQQQGYGGFRYEICVRWKTTAARTIEGCWSIGTAGPVRVSPLDTEEQVSRAWRRGLEADWAGHCLWWERFWSQSSLSVPDPILERQWYREIYKFGSASRRGAPPITLQAVWTADNGSLPPWKGDFHNDLNTQLSYWPAYSSNHLEEGLAFLDWLWAIRAESKRYTRTFFGSEGLNVAGVATLTGQPMGGWAQYSLSPTVSAWLAHHFYLHWRYSRDREFLEARAYPWIKDVAVFLDSVSLRDPEGRRRLPLSSSPEIHDNRIDAWFARTTNFDLALIRWLYGAAAELAGELGLKGDAARWRQILAEWPDFARSPEDGRLLIAPGLALEESHRHFSHLMAIHPLGLIHVDGGEEDVRTIRASLAELDRLGTDWWCGYSFAWLGSLSARALDGKKAADALRLFADCFCLPNSFHANGDQSKTGKSRFTYRPFTLEGNFAFAAGLQEMLLQSHHDLIRVFPAVPPDWKDVRFERLRAEGAFLVSGEMKTGRVREVRIFSEKGGMVRLLNPMKSGHFTARGFALVTNAASAPVLEIETRPGTEIVLSGE